MAATGPTPKVIVTEEKEAVRPIGPVTGSPDAAWRAIGWLGFLLAVVALSDIALHWYPLGFPSPEWEFGTVALSFGGLPFLTLGVGALLASGLARGHRGVLLATGIACALLALAIGAAYLLFLTVVPMAVKAAPAAGALGVKKAVVRTSLLGLGFFVIYLSAALAALRHLGLARRRTHA